MYVHIIYKYINYSYTNQNTREMIIAKIINDN